MPWCPGARVYRLAAINRYHGDGKHTTHLVWIIYGTWYPFMNILVGVVCIYIYIMIIIFNNTFDIYIYIYIYEWGRAHNSLKIT